MAPPAERTLWSLARGSQTAKAAIRQIPEPGLELRLLRNAHVVSSAVYRDASELILKAEDKHAELLASGWVDV